MADEAPPRQPRRRLTREGRREVILRAAADLFGEHGFAGTRLEDIAARAGITKQLLYRHFSDKTALYLALLERHRADLPTFTAAMPQAGPLDERLRAVLVMWLDYVATHTHAWKMLFRDSGGGPEVQAFRAEVHARAREVLVDALRTLSGDRLPRRELEPLAEMLGMGQAGLVLWWIDDPRIPRDVLVDAIARVWRGVLSTVEADGHGRLSGAGAA
jgi:AcrR family transcriptional regulator